MTTTDRQGALHDKSGKYTEKAATAPGPGAALAAPASTADRIAAIRDAHQITTHSSTRGDMITKSAGCSCGQVELDWNDRDKQHRDHVDAEIFEAGRSSLAGFAAPTSAGADVEHLQDLRDRMAKAAETLSESAESYGEPMERSRVRGKAEGVRLALSYADEALRDAEPATPSVDERECRTFGQHVAATRHARRDCPVETA